MLADVVTSSGALARKPRAVVSCAMVYSHIEDREKSLGIAWPDARRMGGREGGEVVEGVVGEMMAFHTAWEKLVGIE
jgi:hypothetical protein